MGDWIRSTSQDSTAFSDTVATFFEQGLNDEEIADRMHVPAPVVGLLRELMTRRRQVRIIVQMHGGTVQDVLHDNQMVEITDVLFVESTKYLGDHDAPEFVIDESHALRQHGIYTHVGSTATGRDFFEPMMIAANVRLNYFARED